MAKYTYFLDFGAGNVEIIPDQDAIYHWVQVEQENGFMRKNIKELIITRDYDNIGSFTNATPFNTLWEYYLDITKHAVPIALQILKDGVLDHESTFYILDGDIDINNGIYIIKSITDDSYDVLLSVADDEVDIIDTSMSVYEAQFSYDTTYQLYVLIEGDILPPPIGSWVETNIIGTWARQKSLYNDGSGIFFQGYYYIAWFEATVEFPDILSFNFEYPNCHLLIDVIQFILDDILTGTSLAGMTFVSHFFNDDNNYVTDEVNMLMNTLIEQKSDTKDPDATNKATVGKISFNDLMKDLKAMFNTRWFIDDGDLRIENEKYFYNGLNISPLKDVGIDLTDPAKYTDEGSDKLYIEDSQQYEKASDDKIKTETIKFIDEDTKEFRGDLFYIEYDVITDTGSKKEHTVSFFSTDLAKVINNVDDVQDNGFFMFNCEEPIGATAQIIGRLKDYNDDETANYIINSAFSVKWLLHDYYEYNRYSKTGVLILASGSTTEDTYAVLSSAPIFIQKDIVFLLNNDDSIDINRYIAIYLIAVGGVKSVVNGTILNISHDLNTNFVTVTLGYEL